jgi:hypothetical protein
MHFRLGITLAVVSLVLPMYSVAAPILAPTDFIFGGQVIGPNFVVGSSPGVVETNTWPVDEGPEHAIDGVGQKYLNFGGPNTGIIVTPGVGSTIAVSLTLWTANDFEQRDPASYQLWGSNALISGPGPFLLTNFTPISSGPFALPSGRNPGGSDPLGPNFLTISFANTSAFTSYMIIFPTLKDLTFGKPMQIGEIQLNDASRVPEPATLSLVGAGLVGMILLRRRR